MFGVLGHTFSKFVECILLLLNMTNQYTEVGYYRFVFSLVGKIFPASNHVKSRKEGLSSNPVIGSRSLMA